ncbi:MAG: SDR family oxidoreductase [Promethearchaeota archaeon]
MVKEKLIQKQPFKGKTAIICGGSSGMGLAVAKLFVQHGGSVCIIARRVDVLNQATKEIESVKSKNTEFVENISCDTTDFEKLKPLLEDFISRHGVPDYLFNAVGYACSKYVQDYTVEDFKNNMNVNYYGQLVPILILLPHFMKEKNGHIINFSSMMGYFGIMGYAAYAPTKHAIVGLSEALRNELIPYNIKISVVYPPDTNTPGLQKENETKPEECKMLSESAKILEPEEVGDVVIDGVLKGKYNILPGEAKMIWRLFRHFPRLVRYIVDNDYKKARKKLGKE